MTYLSISRLKTEAVEVKHASRKEDKGNGTISSGHMDREDLFGTASSGKILSLCHFIAFPVTDPEGHGVDRAFGFSAYHQAAVFLISEIHIVETKGDIVSDIPDDFSFSAEGIPVNHIRVPGRMRKIRAALFFKQEPLQMNFCFHPEAQASDSGQAFRKLIDFILILVPDAGLFIMENCNQSAFLPRIPFKKLDLVRFSVQGKNRKDQTV